MVFNNNLLLGAAGAADGYEIDQSIRFNDGDSAYLSKTFSSGSTVTQYTISCWVKRGILGDYKYLFDAGSNYEILRFYGVTNIDSINFEAINGHSVYTNAVFRDVGAWYHIVAVLDSPNATSTDRIRIYVNGERQSVTLVSGKSYPTLNETTLRAGGAFAHGIGSRADGAGSVFFDGYMAEYNCVFGQALDPTEFGEINSDTGQWVPKKYTGSYGTNSFYITGANSADLGADYSGNGNDFTSNGLTAADQMLDTPTNNFAVQNYITGDVDNLNWSEGNLNILADSSARWHTIPATIYPPSGKWGYQATIKSSSGFIQIGWMSEGDIEDGIVGGGKYPSQGTNSNCAFLYNTEAQKHVNNAATLTSGLAGLTTNDVVECLMDIDNGTISWKKNGSAYGPTYTGLNTTDNPLTVPMVAVYGGSSYQVELDYGQGGYTPSDSDYKTIRTANLDDPTIALPEKYFNTVLYEGNGGGQRVGGFQPITETYSVPNSVIFNDDDSPSLTWTPGADASSQTTFTISMWFKRGDLSNNGALIAAYGGSGATLDEIRFNSGDGKIYFRKANVNVLVTTQVLRDPSAWYHLVLAVDTNDATSGDRYKLYLNGSRITAFDTATYPSSGATFTGFTKNVAQYVGDAGAATGSFDGYLAEVIMIDGQALGPDSFGQLDASTNRWIPKDTSGLTFGTNGFYLDMETAPGTGSGAGTDSSGNGNNFTESGLAASDQVTDSPTKNFSTWNPLKTNASATLSNGNLNYTASGAYRTTSTLPVTSGKWYAEFTISAATGSQTWGVVDVDQVSLSDAYIGQRSYEWGIDGLARTYNNGSNAADYTDFTAGDVIGIALDMDNGKVWFRDNDGTFLSGGDPAAGTTPDFSGLLGNICFAAQFTGGDVTINCGQSAYTNTPPTGFNALNTDNLPLSNGDLSAFVWIKNRDATDNHMLFDAVRGVTKDVHSNSTAAEVTNANTLTRFLKNGFEVSNDAEVNTSAESYVAWQWLNDSLSTSSNADGDITSTVLANTTSGVSVLTYSGNGSDNQTIGHGLGIAPKMIFSKRTDTTGNWTMYHDAVGINKVMYLNLSNLPASNTEQYRAVPTSSVYTVGVGGDINNASGTYVAYCFAEVDGFSKAGSYVANASTDGPFVYCGFKPSWVIFFSIAGSGAGRWMLDTVRSPFNVADDSIQANTTAAESSGSSYRLDFLSNGFKVRTSSDFNSSGRTIAFMAFAESPFKTATAR